MGATPAQCSRTERAAPYVLGDLDARSRLAFERHLRVCGRCREEVDILRSAAEVMPLLSAPPQGPDPNDPHLHRHNPALAAIAQASAAANAKLLAAAPDKYADSRPVLQALPGGAAPPAARPRADVDEVRRSAQELRLETAALRGGWTPSAARMIAAGRPTPGRRRRARGSKWRLLRKPVPGPAVVGFAAVAIVAVVTVALSNRIAGIRYERAKAGWTRGGAVIELAGNQLELLVERMPRPRAGTGYQVWVMERKTGEMVPTTAWLALNRAGNAGIDVPGNYHDWVAAAVYVERFHGHESTRSGAVVVADLRHVA